MLDDLPLCRLDRARGILLHATLEVCFDFFLILNHVSEASKPERLHQSINRSIEITSQHPRSGVALRAQFLRQFDGIDSMIRLARRHLVHVVAPDAAQAGILNNHRVATAAVIHDVRAITVGVTLRVAGCGAHVLDGRIRLLTDPLEEHDFDGREVPGGFRVVAFSDALPVGAVEYVMTHDPTRAFAVGGLGKAAV